jgi:fructosamine-3-kinase
MRRNDVEMAATLAEALGGAWRLRALNASGFCATWQAERGAQRLFVKSAPGGRGEPLRAEADGLRALAATRTVRVPEVATLWDPADGAITVLALEWMDLRPPDDGFGTRLGLALAALHGAPVDPPRYGWPRDNVLGATPQANRPTAGGQRADWIDFVARERLGALRERLAAAGAPAPLLGAVQDVVAALPSLFDGERAGPYTPRPSLIHGDLWSGNWGMLADGTPVIYDPAVSWSDAEAELAMMELFGAPPPGFWGAYRDAAGLDEGYARRRGLYQLYHLLNHVLLFGGGYQRQALACAEALCRRA